MANTDKTAAAAAPTLADLFAALNAQSEAKSVTSTFVSAKQLAESKVQFRFKAIEAATNKRFAKEVIRFTIVLKDGSTNVLEMSPTPERTLMAQQSAMFVAAGGTTTLVQAPLPNGKYTYKFQ